MYAAIALLPVLTFNMLLVTDRSRSPGVGKVTSAQLFARLHHHAIIGVVSGAVVSTVIGRGTVGCGVLIISTSHVLKYTHYLATPAGLRSLLKNHLPVWQVGQLYSCSYHAILVLWVWFSDSAWSVVPRATTEMESIHFCVFFQVSDGIMGLVSEPMEMPSCNHERGLRREDRS